MTPSGAPITSSASLAFFQYLQDTPTTTAWFVEMNLYGGTNSAVNKISLDSSSFGWRDSLLTMQLYASSPNYLAPYPEDGIGFVRSLSSPANCEIDIAVSDRRTSSYAHERHGHRVDRSKRLGILRQLRRPNAHAARSSRTILGNSVSAFE